MEQSSVAQRLTSRFIAGRTLADEISVVQRLFADGILTTLDFLGENVNSLEEAQASQRNYLAAFEPIQPYAATVSVKLTQFGLDLSPDACTRNALALVECAQRFGTSVEVDMESSQYTQRTIQIVEALNREFPGRVRVALQAYLFRSEQDVLSLSEQGIPVRLCKGAYREPPSIAFTQKPEVDANYLKLARLLLLKGADPAIAGHDDAVIAACLAYIREQNIPPRRFEFQMLYGIRRDLQRGLVEKGYRLRLYVPYGDAWFPYFMRRLAERPANLVFLARNLVRR
jgi:proline dehydrogenase